MDLADLSNEPVPYRTGRGTLLATPGSFRKLGPVQAWLNRQPRPAGLAAAPPFDPMTPPDPNLPPQVRQALAQQRIAAMRGQKPDDGWPPDLFGDADLARKLVLDSDEAMGLVLAAAFGRHQPEYADPAAAVALLDDLTYLQAFHLYHLALGLRLEDDAGPNAGPPAPPPPSGSDSGAGPTTSTTPSTSPSDTPPTP